MMNSPPATLDSHTNQAMKYPYDMLTAACLFIIVVASSILLSLSLTC
jgi:hypothetical protein